MCISVSVKLDPVVFTEAKAKTGGCIKLQWTYGKASFVKDLKCQLRYRSEFQTEWAKVNYRNCRVFAFNCYYHVLSNIFTQISSWQCIFLFSSIDPVNTYLLEL